MTAWRNPHSHRVMGRRTVSKQVTITPADCMRRKRQSLYDSNFVQCKLQIPVSFGDHLKSLKAKYKMRGLDNVVSAMIRKAIANYSADELIAPPPPDDFKTVKQIAVHIPRDHHAFLEAVAHRNRGITLGVALETVAAHVSDLSPAPLQLSLIEGGTP